MPEFIPGLKLSEYLYHEAIEPLLAQKYPHLNYSAARLGWGSDVMGFDTPMSMDHGWGPKLTLFLNEKDYSELHQELEDFFAWHLPLEIRGFPTNFGEPLEDGGRMEAKDTSPIRHMITITTLEKLIMSYLGMDTRQPLTPPLWLSLPQQRLRTIRSGRIYHDGLGRISPLRQALHWYPHDLWLYLMGNQWRRIDQDEPFVGRTGSVGDELGSRLIAARLIHDMMSLLFLMEKQYAPYSKWFGSAFKKLSNAPRFTPIFQQILNCESWQEREKHLSQAYQHLVDAHNALDVTPNIKPEISNFYNRPFLVPHSSRFVIALQEQIKDPVVKALPPHLGSIDQFIDNTDVLESIDTCQEIRGLFKPDHQ